MDKKQPSIKIKKSGFSQSQEILPITSEANINNVGHINLIKADTNRQLIIQDNQSIQQIKQDLVVKSLLQTSLRKMINAQSFSQSLTPVKNISAKVKFNNQSDQKENVQFIPDFNESYDDQTNSLSVKVGQQPVKQVEYSSYDQKKQEIKEQLQNISDQNGQIEQQKTNEGLGLANQLFQMQQDRQKGNFTQEDSLAQNKQAQSQEIEPKELYKQIYKKVNKIDQQINLDKWLMDRNIKIIETELPTLEDLQKVKNIHLVIPDGFFETCTPTDQWQQVKDKNGQVIKYSDCQKYGKILRLFVSSYYSLPNNPNKITFVQMYILSKYDSQLQETGSFIFLNQPQQEDQEQSNNDKVMTPQESSPLPTQTEYQRSLFELLKGNLRANMRPGAVINDMNIKLQTDSIHFIQYLNGYNKIFKYTVDNEYGSIELVNDQLYVESDIKITFSNDCSDKYQDNYQYLFGQKVKGGKNVVYKYSDHKLQEIIKENLNGTIHHSFYETVSKSLINFYWIWRYSSSTFIEQRTYENGKEKSRSAKQFKYCLNSNFISYQCQQFINKTIDNKQYKIANLFSKQFFFPDNYNELPDSIVEEEGEQNDYQQQKIRSKLGILEDKQFFLIDSNKLIIMNGDQIEFVNFTNDHQPNSVKDKTIIHQQLFDKGYVFVNKHKQNFIPQKDGEPYFPRVTDFKYQQDQHISFIARTKTDQNVIETSFYRLDVLNPTIDGLFMIKFNYCFPLEQKNIEYQLSSVNKDGKRKYQIVIPLDCDGQYKFIGDLKQTQIFEFQIQDNHILPVQTFLIDTDENLQELYQLSIRYIVPEYDETGQQIGTNLYYKHQYTQNFYEIPLDETKMSKLSNKFISAGYSHYVRNQEISFYVLGAKFNNNNQQNFSIREAILILNQSLKIILTMKLTSFEDYDHIIDDHQIISQNKLQPLAFKNGMSLIGEQLLSLEDQAIDSSFLEPLKTQFIPRQSIISKLHNKNDIAKYFQVNNLFDLLADFDQNQFIALSIKRGDFILANEIVQRLLENDEDYEFKNSIMMKALPNLIEHQQIYIKTFVHRNENDQEIRKVSLEQIIKNNKLPKKGSKKCSYFHIAEQTCSQVDLEVNELLYHQKFASKETVDIEYSFIDFFHTTLQMKIDEINGKQTKTQKYVFKGKKISKVCANELFIARLINNRTDKDFYENKIIQKIIGRQSEEFTQAGTKKLAKIYLLGFIKVYTIDVLIRNQFKDDFTDDYTAWIVLNICRATAFVTQIYFFYLEYLEIRWGYAEYFSNFVNLADFFQFPIYVSHVIMSTMIINDGKQRLETLIIVNSYFEVLMTILSLVKMLQLLASFNQLQIHVILINKVIMKLGPFFIVYSIFLIAFSVMLLVAQGQYILPLITGDFDDSDPKYNAKGTSEDYPTFPTFVATLMQTYRFSVGAQLGVEPRKLYKNSPFKYGISSALVWFVFFIIQLILQIVILNFLIAEINDLFEKIKSGVPQFYMMLGEQNNVYLLKNEKPYIQILIIQAPVNYLPNNIDQDDFTTISSKIYKYTQQQTQDLFFKNKEQQVITETKIKESQLFMVSRFKEEIQIIKTDVSEMKAAQTEMKTKLETEMSEVKASQERIEQNLVTILHLLRYYAEDESVNQLTGLNS